MNRATILGIGGGLLVGAAAGTFGQAATRVRPHATQADRDEWRDRFDEHFADEVLADAHRAGDMDDLIRRDLRAHDAPDGIQVSRHSGSMLVTWDDEPNRHVYATLATIGGLLGLGIGIGVAATVGRTAGDMHRYRGVGGAAAIAVPAAFGAFLVANVASNLVMDAREAGSP